MSGSVRQKIIEELGSRGFAKGRGGAFSESDEVLLIVDPNISRKTGQFSLSTGIWLKALRGEDPSGYWRCHIYGGAGNLMPDLEAGVKAIERSIGSGHDLEAAVRVASALADRSRDLMTFAGVRVAFLRGDFTRCMILKEARRLLEGSGETILP